MERLASAPISWGVCEVPGWGLALPAERVLSEMASLGIAATELGPDGYLPADSAGLQQLVASHGMQMIGGFVPLVVHDPAEEGRAIDTARRAASLMSGAGATMLVSSAITSWDWAPRCELDDSQWKHAMAMLNRIDEIASEHGMTQALHPHFGTIIETKADMDRFLECSNVGITLDTGHLLIGGCDPLAFVHDHFDRIRHVHLKDVRMSIAQRVLDGQLTLMQGVQAGMFCRLGSGDVDIDQIIVALESRGYQGWYVIEQDAAITGGTPPAGAGPLSEVAASVDHLRDILLNDESQDAKT